MPVHQTNHIDGQANVYVHRLFNPRGLCQQLSLTHANRLEHLALLISEVSNKSLILREHAIVHFKDFHQLKHLEFDTRLLRLGEDSSPPSMTEVIPHSLQCLGLFVCDPNPQIITTLISKLAWPQRRSGFPALEKIVVATPSEIINMVRIGQAWMQMEVRFRRRFRRAFTAVGITLEFKSVSGAWAVEPRQRKRKPIFDWTEQTNIDHIHDDVYSRRERDRRGLYQGWAGDGRDRDDPIGDEERRR